MSDRELASRAWCTKTTDGGRAPIREWRVCQLEACPWGLFEERILFDSEDVPRATVICKGGALHRRLG